MYKYVVIVLKEPTKLRQAKLNVLVVQLILQLSLLEQELKANAIVRYLYGVICM